MSYQVQVSWDGVVVPGVLTSTPLAAGTGVVTMYDGALGSVYKVPGRPDTSPLTLRRPVDDNLTFDGWASGPHLKKQVELALIDVAARLTVVYRLHQCWVSGYSVEADADSGVATESITLTMNRWERVTPTVPELAERRASLAAGLVRRVSMGELLTGSTEETGRRVDALVREAQATGAVLLFDEAEALFGRRTTVEDAHDRYDPTELDVVVDRLSAYQGGVLVVPPGEDG